MDCSHIIYFLGMMMMVTVNAWNKSDVQLTLKYLMSE